MSLKNQIAALKLKQAEELKKLEEALKAKDVFAKAKEKADQKFRLALAKASEQFETLKAKATQQYKKKIEASQNALNGVLKPVKTVADVNASKAIKNAQSEAIHDQ
ncbi:F0F1-type ATP synthase membrane subunit b/b' [Polynucleobacter sphagniphilus]|uniref:hypothetical protein n=1 Tax=Polynucleobacter sphagniphilus TaxID=1743169 RepID=UPI002473412D|nr:hypothetical protein [Polynucleobacter sphagniphilus]MDH6303327.1 F0F1-type ATP synthase membrane subunit b/b' [Polynucleobacter sphagniphilus]